jgi:hypothetical protein
MARAERRAPTLSTQQALAFIATLRGLCANQREQLPGGPTPSLEQLLELARRQGFVITAEELTDAHRADWKIRLAAKLHQNTAAS